MIFKTIINFIKTSFRYLLHPGHVGYVQRSSDEMMITPNDSDTNNYEKRVIEEIRVPDGTVSGFFLGSGKLFVNETEVRSMVSCKISVNDI